jgi:hypothetical protein
MKMNKAEMIDLISREVRCGDDVECGMLDVVQLIVAHIADPAFELNQSKVLPTILHDVTEITKPNDERLNMMIEIGNAATNCIINELLTRRADE